MALDINALLQAGESETVEFKAQWTDAVLETAASLANTRGGILLVGLCQQQGLPEPEFRSQNGRFEVLFLKDPYTKDYLRTMGLDERRMKAVLYVKESGSITNREFRELTGVSDEMARRALSGLTEKGLLAVKGKGRSVRYEVRRPEDVGD